MAWTKAQQSAIDTRDKTLLVSAAAGSGKTATLTERIIRSILDESSNIDISRMLIVTFTNAAVEELRERIGKAIKKAAIDNPENPRLEEQLLKLKDAKILTITAFCNSILRTSAESVGLSPNYRIAEPAEAKILASSILEGLINAAYENELQDVCTADEFIALADCLSDTGHTDGLNEAMSLVYDKLTSIDTGIDTLKKLIDEYDPEKFESVEKTKLGGYLFDRTISLLSEYLDAFKKTARLASCEKVDEKNLPKLNADIEKIESILSKKTYKELREEIIAFSQERLSRSPKEEPTEFYLKLQALRKLFTEDIKEIRDKFFLYSEEEWQYLYTKLYKLLGTFYKFLKKFYQEFMDEKRRRGVCEFSDIERYAFEALFDKDGNLTELSIALREQFDAIYVDEYQDVNALQALVFTAISKPNNRFMVGDIKQSIYGFRSARPEIFAEMKNTFPPLEEAADESSASIFMSNNFRCDRNVVDFVNGIFDKMFGKLGENIGYVDSDKLVFSKIYPEGSIPTNHVPEIHIIEKRDKVSYDDFSEEDFDIEEDIDAAEDMARHITEKILDILSSGKLANGKNPQPSDIAILLRSVRGKHAEAITRALEKAGISSSIAEMGDLFLSEEVLLALSFLYSIDNPRKDIYLSALMCSPIFGFTPDELLKIRNSSKSETLWEALNDYVCDFPEDEKAKYFIASLKRYRKLSEGYSADALLSLIYRESGILAYAARSGGKDNLILFYSYARKFEQSDFKGLNSFISYINEVISNQQEFSAAGKKEESNSVKIMTVHKSKGLEFPVCFLANAGAHSSSDKNKITFSEKFGIAIKTKDESGLASIENPARLIIKKLIKNEEFEEELRVLYVALTRAREQLYVYAISPKKSADEYIESMNTLRELDTPLFLSKAKSFLDIIMVSRNCGKLYIDSNLTNSENNEEAIIKESAEIEEKESSERISKDELLRRFNFRFPHKELETLPEKISVSRLKPDILDEEDNAVELKAYFESAEIQTEEKIEEPTKKVPTLPSFVSGTDSSEAAKRGIATHMMLQFCDFDLLEQNGTASELDRLIKKEFISEDDGNRVRKNEIDKFITSKLFKELKEAKKLYRELRFNVKLPAELFTTDDEKKKALIGKEILTQGVIDCVIENDIGELHLIDYKTDRLTKEELISKELGEERLINTHKLQLSYYVKAIELMFGRRPKKVGLYSLHLGREIEIPESCLAVL